MLYIQRAFERTASEAISIIQAIKVSREQGRNYTTWRRTKKNLAVLGIDAQIDRGDSFHNDRHTDFKADYALAEPRSVDGSSVPAPERKSKGTFA